MTVYGKAVSMCGVCLIVATFIIMYVTLDGKTTKFN